MDYTPGNHDTNALAGPSVGERATTGAIVVARLRGNRYNSRFEAIWGYLGHLSRNMVVIQLLRDNPGRPRLPGPIKTRSNPMESDCNGKRLHFHLGIRL